MIAEHELLQAIIDAVNASGTAAHGNNYNRYLPSVVGANWNNDLRVKADNPHKGKIHSWMAYVVTSGQKRQGARVNHYFGVRLRGVLFCWDEGDLDNSDRYFGLEIQQVKDYFAEHKDLGLEQQATGFLTHDEIQEPNRAVQHAGNGSAHVVNLYLGCRLFKLLTTP